MIKYLLMLITGLVLFSASASAAWMMKASEPDPEASDEETENTKSSVPPMPPADVAPTSEVPGVLPASKGVSAETVLRLSDSIRKKEKSLLAREQSVERDEKRLKLMLDDLRRERTEITAMMEEAEQRALQARELLESVQSNSGNSNNGTEGGSDSKSNQPDSSSQNNPISEHEMKNLRTVADWLKEMPAEKAAKSLQDLCNDGKMEMAVQLLSFLEQRDAAKILAALQDPSLITRLAERFRTLDNTLRK